MKSADDKEARFREAADVVRKREWLRTSDAAEPAKPEPAEEADEIEVLREKTKKHIALIGWGSNDNLGHAHAGLEELVSVARRLREQRDAAIARAEKTEATIAALEGTVIALRRGVPPDG